jgi:hypothetical protein
MKQKYYINKGKHFKTLKTYVLIGLSSLTVLIIINFISYKISGFMAVSFILGGAVLISLASLYRTIFLLKLPLVSIDEKSIKYFNILWYNSHKWDKFELAHFNTEDLTISIGLTNGRMFDKFMLDSLSEQDIENIKIEFIERNKLIQ